MYLNSQKYVDIQYVNEEKLCYIVDNEKSFKVFKRKLKI